MGIDTRMYVFYVRSGKTMAQIARECNLTLSHISKVIGGSRKPSIETAVDLSRVLAVPLQEVVEAAGMKWGRVKWEVGHLPAEPQLQHQQLEGQEAA